MEKNPITQVNGIFNSYADDETVVAKEYNGNMKAFKDAIEHNGAILKKHQEDIKTLSTGNIPDGGIETSQIAPEAVTKEKLSQEVALNLFTANNISSYFADYLIQVHKHTPDIKGLFLNGNIINTEHAFKAPLGYTKQVQMNMYGELISGERVLFTKNKYPVDSYKFSPYTEQSGTYKAWGCTWNSKYFFETPVALTKDDAYFFKYNTIKEPTRASSNSMTFGNYVAYSFSIKAHKEDGSVVDLTPYFKKADSSYVNWMHYYKEVAYTAEFVPDETYTTITDVVALQVDLTGRFSLEGKAFYGEDETVRFLEEMAVESCYSETLYSNQSMAALQYENTVRLPNVLSTVHFSYRLNDVAEVTRALDFNGTKLDTKVYCAADMLPGTELICVNENVYLGLQDFISCLDNAQNKYTVTMQDEKTYFIEQTFTRPYCIVFKLKEQTTFEHFGTLQAGTYKLTYDAFSEKASRLYDNNYQACIDNLYQDCDKPENIEEVITEVFQIANNYLQYRVTQNFTDLKLKDMCVVSY